MEIKILGAGCTNCNTLEKLTREVVEKNSIVATITKVEYFIEIMKLGVMTTPALVVDGQVLVKGRVPSIAEISELLIEIFQKKGNQNQ